MKRIFLLILLIGPVAGFVMCAGLDATITRAWVRNRASIPTEGRFELLTRQRVGSIVFVTMRDRTTGRCLLAEERGGITDIPCE